MVVQQKTHYVNGGSVIARRMQCPGSLEMERLYGEEPEEMQATKDGTLVHECIEELGPVAIENAFKPDKFKGAPKLYSYDSAHIEAAKLACLDILRILGDKAHKVSYAFEHKFIIDAELELGGTADFCYGYSESGKRVAGIWDYKNGVKPRYAAGDPNSFLYKHMAVPGDPQIQQYLVGIQHTIGKNKPFDVFYGHIFQPNSSKPYRVDGKPAENKVEYTLPQINRIKQEQILVAEVAMGRHGKEAMFLRTGDECFHCRGKARCPKYNEKVNEHALVVFDAHDKKLEGRVATKEEKIKQLPALVASLPDEDVYKFWQGIDYMEAAIKAVKAHIRARAINNNPIGKTKCVYGTAKRQYDKTKTAKEIGEYYKSIGIAKPWIKDVINIGVAEDVLRALGKTDEEIKALIEPVVVRGNKPISIIDETKEDSREEIGLANVELASKVFD